MKLIYGRAGSGKSEYVFNEVAKRLEKYENNSLKNENGKLENNENEKIFIITPEQFSYTAEKRLLEKIESSATTNVEVISFERMAYRVIKELFTGNKINLENLQKQ